MRRKAKPDANQTEIVRTFRKMGATVLHTHRLHNCFDILVGYKGVNIVVEIKDGKKPPSQRKLSDGELEFKDTWKGGEYHIIKSVEEVIQLLKKYDNGKN